MRRTFLAPSLVSLVSLALGVVTFSCVGDDPVVGGTPDASAGGSDASGGGPDTGAGDATPPTDAAKPGDDAGGPDAAPACGSPGSPCCAGSACQGGATCNAGTCACAADKTACGGACVDTKVEPTSCGRCGHDCLGGTCAAGKCKAITLSTGHTNFGEMVADGGRLYFTRSGNNFITGGLFSVKLDGTDLKAHHEVGMNQPCGGASIAGGKLYFICAGGASRRLLSCTLPGCASPPAIVRDGIGTNAHAVAADPTSGKVFYAVRTAYNQSTGGGIFESSGAQVGAANQPNPADVRVSGGYVYWLNAGTYASDAAQKNGGVRRASIASPAAQADVVGTNTIYFDNGTLAVDPFSVYYTGRNSITSKSDVVVAPVAGGGLTVFSADLAVSSVVSDGTNVFFDDRTTDTVHYCARASGCSGGKAILATSEADVTTMALDEKSVFWTKTNGEIRRIAKP